MALFKVKPQFRRRGKTLSKYGLATPLYVERFSLAATTLDGDYALFGGGTDLNNQTSMLNVDAYDKSLVKYTPQNFSVGVYDNAATYVGNYALFGGGYSTGYGQAISHMPVYDKSLTKISTRYLPNDCFRLTATHLKDYALFGSGQSNTMRVVAVDASLTQHTNLATTWEQMKATSVGDYAFFGGGYNSNNPVFVISNTLTYTQCTPMTVERQAYSSAASVGDYALFAGGQRSTYPGTTYYDSIEVYDKNLTKQTTIYLSYARSNMASISLEDYALFGGGYNSNEAMTVNRYRNEVDAYDKSLTLTIVPKLSEGKQEFAGASVGNYALFGGGHLMDFPYRSDKVEVYQVA